MASHGLHAVIHGSYQMARWPLSLTMACKGARGPFHSQWPSEGQMAALTHDGLQRARGALWALSPVAFSAKRANGLRGAGGPVPLEGRWTLLWVAPASRLALPQCPTRVTHHLKKRKYK